MIASAIRSIRRSLCFQCDEIYPTCSNCKRLDSICSLGSSESPTDSEVVEKKLNIDDLQLLHDWHMGSDTRFSDHTAEESFRQQRGREIEIGFKHPYGTIYPSTDTVNLSLALVVWSFARCHADFLTVLHIILAIAALHLTSTRPTESKWYSLAVSHNNAAIRLVRPHVASSDPAHGEALFNFSGFNSLFSFAEPVLRPNDSSPRDYIGDLLDSFQMARGIRAIIAKDPEILAREGLINNPAWSYNTTDIESVLTETYPQMVELQTAINQHIRDADQRDATLRSTRTLFINMAVLDNSPKDHSSASLIQRWAIEAEEPFFTLCEDRHPIALVLLAWYALLCQKRANIWFFRRWPRLLLCDVENQLQGTEWAQWIVEPKAEVERLISLSTFNGD